MEYSHIPMEPVYLLLPDEFHHSLNIAKKSRDRPILFLLGCSGLRLGELIRGKAAALCLEAGPHTGADNAESRISLTILLPLLAIARLRHHSAGGDIGGRLPLQSKNLGLQLAGDIYAS
jgi:hypothetical protein